VLRLHTSNVLKQTAIDIHFLNVLEIMNRYEQETHNNIKRIAVALEQLAKLLTKLAKEQND